jgi:putative DNA methylase
MAMAIDRIAHYNSSLCPWHNTVEKADSMFGRQAFPMVWDFVETFPFGDAVGDIRTALNNIAEIIDSLSSLPISTVIRGSASSLPLPDASFDAVITDPPYYDNIWYADLADFFYVWLKRSVGGLWPDDLGGTLTPKRSEIVVAPYRFGNDKGAAKEFYEEQMATAFGEANRVLRPGGLLVCIYAHKTTLGWATLVDALRSAGFVISEAWPLDTEMTTALKSNVAALASSIFLVARKREPDVGVGDESAVLAELDEVVTERLGRLAEAGVTGSDLVIAAVGAGLRALTRYEHVEQDNGEPLPSERFLAIVQNRVLDAIFGGLGGADPVTRFYVAAQFSYGYASVDFAEANNLAWMTGIELTGAQGLSTGARALVEKKGSTIRILDFEERGEDERLGLPDAGFRAPVIDVAHAVLWRAEHHPADLQAFLAESYVDPALLRAVMQALAGKALRSGSGDNKSREAAAAERALGSWRRLVDEHVGRDAESSGRLFSASGQ